MTDQQEVVRQNIDDLKSVIIVLTEILSDHSLNDDQRGRVNYCEKVVKNVTKKQLEINALR